MELLVTDWTRISLRTLSDLIVQARMFLRRSTTGRAELPMVMAEAPDGSYEECYVKGPAFHPRKSPFALENEWMAANLCKLLGLPCSEPRMVRLSPEFLETVKREETRRHLESGTGILFASISVGTGWAVWSDAITPPRASLPLVVGTYLFDTAIQNWNRSIPNPNLLVKGDTFILIDHEDAFIEAKETSGEKDYHQEPWMNGAINNYYGEYEEHPFWRK
ncbi:MAG: HipA family kinase [Pseudomonadota bacterium]